jgi:hypothetical protein
MMTKMKAADPPGAEPEDRPTARECPGCGFLVTEREWSLLPPDMKCVRCGRYGHGSFSKLYPDRDKVVRSLVETEITRRPLRWPRA